MQEPADLPAFFRPVFLPIVDSTSDEAKRLARDAAPEGTLVWAERQTAGHGRLGRTWISPPGNLYVSLLLRPRAAAAEAAQLTFVAAVAAAECLEQILPAGRAVTCKWPNDVLVGGRKAVGILLESEADHRGNLDSLVIGIGINVSSHPPDDVVQYAATSLHAEGAAGETPSSVLERLCLAILLRYRQWQEEGFSPLRVAWLARAEKLNSPIEVRLETGTAAGIFAGLDPSGALVLQQGELRRLVLAGDVFPAVA